MPAMALVPSGFEEELGLGLEVVVCEGDAVVCKGGVVVCKGFDIDADADALDAITDSVGVYCVHVTEPVREEMAPEGPRFAGR
jgi:hypothetical protein